MKKFSIALFLLLAFVLLPSSAHAITYAQFAIGGGYESVILVSNKTGFPWNGRIYVMRDYNQRWQGQWAINGQNFSGMDAANFSLNPHASGKYRITGDSVTRSGDLEIDGEVGFSTLDIAVSYFYEVRSNGVLMDTVGDSPSAWGDGFALAVEKTATVNTGLAWCPSWRFSSNVFLLNLTLYDQDGNVARQKSVTFNGHAAQFIDQIFIDLPASFRGYLRIDAQDYIYLTVLRMESTPTGWQFTSTPADDYVR